MTKGQRTIVALLAAGAVLLGLNLGIRRTASAQAQPPPFAPRVVGIALENTRVWRIWSDGVIETRRFNPFPSDSQAVCWFQGSASTG